MLNGGEGNYVSAFLENLFFNTESTKLTKIPFPQPRKRHASMKKLAFLSSVRPELIKGRSPRLCEGKTNLSSFPSFPSVQIPVRVLFVAGVAPIPWRFWRRFEMREL